MKKIATVSLIFLLAVSLFAGEMTKDFNKTIFFKSNGNITVKNTNGKITVQPGSDGKVIVEAYIKVKGSSRNKVRHYLDETEIIIDKSGDELYIKVDHPNNSSSFLGLITGSKPNVSVNFEIKVPKESNVSLKSTNGRVFVENLIGAVDLSSVNGSVDAENIKGSINAHTTNGSVNAELTAFDNRQNINLKTVNGSVNIKLKSDIDAEFDLSTVNGKIHTDFPIEISGNFSKKNIKGTINDGGKTIRISTVNGSIHINEI